MKIFGVYILTPIISFLGGMYAYVWMLRFFWSQGSGELEFILFWGGQAFFIFATPLYLIIIHFIDKNFNRSRIILYPLGCMIAFFLPSLVISWGGSFFSPEIMLFHGFFLTSGLLFGLLNWGFKKIFNHLERKKK